jgi:hypothetical protein
VRRSACNDSTLRTTEVRMNKGRAPMLSRFQILTTLRQLRSSLLSGFSHSRFDKVNGVVLHIEA